MNNYEDVMLDLETLGRAPGCAIVAIGAVQFSIKDRKLGERFYMNIDAASCVKAGLTLDADTVMWWMRQSDAARSALTRNARPLDDALTEFAMWLGALGEFDTRKVWGNGPSFDNAILAAAYRAAKIDTPWPFWGDRCFRTIKGLFPSVTMAERQGVHHHALDDAIHQAEHILKIKESLNARKAS